MPTDKLLGVHPQLRGAVLRILSVMADLGHPMLVTDGVRTAAQQAALYAQGRTAPGAIVTALSGAHGSESNHQPRADGLGHAVDCCFLDAGGQPSWAESHPWRLYGELAKTLGCRWGGDWQHPDRPHIELPVTDSSRA